MHREFIVYLNTRGFPLTEQFKVSMLESKSQNQEAEPEVRGTLNR
jgi:hypothetical protein